MTSLSTSKKSYTCRGSFLGLAGDAFIVLFIRKGGEQVGFAIAVPAGACWEPLRSFGGGSRPRQRNRRT